METTVAALPDLDALRRHVFLTLCDHDRLDPEQAVLQQSVIFRAKRPCGLFFETRGPRLLRSYAVWAGEENRILYYDSAGARFGETRLSEAPDPLKLAA